MVSGRQFVTEKGSIRSRGGGKSEDFAEEGADYRTLLARNCVYRAQRAADVGGLGTDHRSFFPPRVVVDKKYKTPYIT